MKFDSVTEGSTYFIGALIANVIANVILGLLVSYPIMLLWNECLVPAVSVIKPISWIQAWGIMLLVNLFRPSDSK
jgi:hypothetical protein